MTEHPEHPEQADEGVGLGIPCPYCGHHTLFKPEGWVEGGPVVCANPFCDSHRPEDDAS